MVMQRVQNSVGTETNIQCTHASSKQLSFTNYANSQGKVVSYVMNVKEDYKNIHTCLQGQK